MLYIHKLLVIENEHLYGPGKRLLLFLQGCSLHCEGCINQHLWPFEGGIPITTEEIIAICDKENLDGITVHGGEPLDQPKSLLELVNGIKNINKTVILFTGYLKKELNSMQKQIWDKSDIVVAGRFQIKKRNVNLQFRGSTNQKVYRHIGPYKNYKIQDGYTTAIFTLEDNGNVNVNGFLTNDIAELIYIIKQ